MKNELCSRKIFKYRVKFSGENESRIVFIKSHYDSSNYSEVLAIVYRMLIAKYGISYVNLLTDFISIRCQ